MLIYIEILKKYRKSDISLQFFFKFRKSFLDSRRRGLLLRCGYNLKNKYTHTNMLLNVGNTLKHLFFAVIMIIILSWRHTTPRSDWNEGKFHIIYLEYYCIDPISRKRVRGYIVITRHTHLYNLHIDHSFKNVSIWNAN